MAAGYSDGTLRIFQIASSEMEMKLYPHAGVAVTAIQYSASGERRGGNFLPILLTCCDSILDCLFHRIPLNKTAVGAGCFYTELSCRSPAMGVYYQPH